MRFFIIFFVFLLVGCAVPQSNQPIFTDSEKSQRADQYDEWYLNAAKGL